MKPLQPKSGEIAFREWKDDEGARHVLLVAALRPHPYTNILTRLTEKQKSYGAWQRHTKVRLTLAVPKSYKPLARGPLVAVFGAGMKLWRPPGATRMVSVDRVDNTNLLKAIEDVFNDILWTDDKLIRRSEMIAIDDKADWFSVSVWGPMPNGGTRLHPSPFQGEDELGPDKADWLREDLDAVAG